MAKKKPSVEERLQINSTMIDIMLEAIADHVEAIVSVLPKCSCGKPKTVINQQTNESSCDLCCARLIVDAKLLTKNYIANTPERLDVNWTDLPHADAIRQLTTHYDLITELDVVVH